MENLDARLLNQQPSCSILIRSCEADREWLGYALRSMSRFCFGFLEIVLLVADYDKKHFQSFSNESASPPVRLKTYKGDPKKPMLSCMAAICHAEEYCQGDLVLNTDSDCVFTQSTAPATFLVDNKPILLVRTFESLRQRPGYVWKKPTETCLRIPVTHETMARHPAVHWKDIYLPFRRFIEDAHGTQFMQFALSGPECFPWFWAEFPALGFYVMTKCPERYHLVDVSSLSEDEITKQWKTHIYQGWSHFNPNAKSHMEAAERQRRHFQDLTA